MKFDNSEVRFIWKRGERMKVIFLDVDGVLNSKDDLLIYRAKNNITGCILYAEVEDRPLKLLKEIIDKTNAKIVVSSSWRVCCDRSGKESIFGNKLYTKLINRLSDYDIEVYDITPSFNPKPTFPSFVICLAPALLVIMITVFLKFTV